MADVSESWQCDGCGEVHEYEDDAVECCAPRIIEGYTCKACGDFHRLRADAEACCGIACASCGTHHNDADAATECCGVPYIYKPTPAELEAAGQQRLAL